MESNIDDPQFCLRWNNFQANITSQFEVLRDDEDFTDVTLACDGQKIQAHKVVLSACSPFFKELFKANPCSHPIIFMRDVEACDIASLMEFMYAGEVNVAQAHLPTFLKTAESLKIRGLTDTSTEGNKKTNNTLHLNPETITSIHNSKQITSSSSSTVTSSQDVQAKSPLSKRHKNKAQNDCSQLVHEDDEDVSFIPINNNKEKSDVQPKVELGDYISDEEGHDDDNKTTNFYSSSGEMEVIPQTSQFRRETTASSPSPGLMRLRRRRRSFSEWHPLCNVDIDDAPAQKPDKNKKNRLIKLGEGIEVGEEQLRSVKWSDYRKLTRGLASILFSPSELATCSVTGQRWSRAGSGERPVKPALERSKVQAIISYVAMRFPMVEISRIKQVLAYKCKENSTAFKMKAVRYYEDQHAK